MEFVNVTIRIKSHSTNDSEDNTCVQIIKDDPTSLYIPHRNQIYTFDKIFDQDADQNVIFTTLIDPLIKKVLLGYNCTVFAYGQTGTGKTYTMGSDMKELNGKNVGIIKRVFQSMFIENSEDIAIELSVCEIYQEKVYDLLGKNKTALTVKGINSIALTKVKVCDLNSVEKLLLQSCRRRHTDETKQNTKSSRSHAVFTIYVNAQDENGTKLTKLNLVDLAGCESVKKTGTQYNQFNEAVKINMGLFAVRSVVNALTSNKTCIPYRHSMLTRILYDSLNKRSYITLIACISPNITDLHETLQTLEFALLTKRMKTKPELNNVLAEYNRNAPGNYHHSIAFYNTKTPMKRTNPFIHTSTTVKRPKFTSSVSSLYSQSIPRNLELYSDTVSPIAKAVIDKIENHYGQNIGSSTSSPSFYEVVCKLVQEEVHLQTNTTNNPVAIQSTLNITTNDVNIELDALNEISGILHLSPNKINISGAMLNNSNQAANSKQANGSTHVNKHSTPEFKVPQLLKRHCITPMLENANSARRSLRLSMKMKSTNNQSSPKEISCDSKIRNNIRRSIRIAQHYTNRVSLDYCETNNLVPELENSKKTSFSVNVENVRISEKGTRHIVSKSKRKNKFSLKKQNTFTNTDLNDSSIEKTNSTSKESQDIIDTSQENTFYEEETIKTFPVLAQRRSIRLSKKNALSSTIINHGASFNTSCSSVRSVLSTHGTKTKTVKVHNDEVLRILNKGSTKELQKLHTIGAKTAEQICLFRKLNGAFRKISDLQQVLYRGKYYERFITGNFLSFEVSPNNSLN